MTSPSPRRRLGHRRAAPLLALLATVAVLLGAGACGARPDSSPRTTSSATSVPVTSAPVTSAAADRSGTGGSRAVPGATTVARIAPRGLRPVRVQIPAIGVDAAMTDLGIGRNGAIEVPTDPARAGWLTTTPAPGQRGPAVIAGHVDSLTGPAVFVALRELSVDDPIIVTRRDGSRVTFTVDGVRTYAKRAFPSREVYGPVPGPALRLITCGGTYVKSRGGYQANVVVYAS